MFAKPPIAKKSWKLFLIFDRPTGQIWLATNPPCNESTDHGLSPFKQKGSVRWYDSGYVPSGYEVSAMNDNDQGDHLEIVTFFSKIKAV